MSKLIIKRPDLSQGGFLALPHAIIRDRGLSIDAIGILTVIASNADGWDYTVKSLAKSLRITENRTRNAVRELEAAGLLKRDQPIDPVTRKTLDGTWTIDLTTDRRSGIHATAPTSTDDASPQVETVESIPAPRKSTRLIEDHDQKISSRREAPATASFSITDQMRSWAQENHPHVNVDQATEKYIAYYADKTTSRQSWEKWIAREKAPVLSTAEAIKEAGKIDRRMRDLRDAGDDDGATALFHAELKPLIDKHDLIRDEWGIGFRKKPKPFNPAEWSMS